MDKLKMLPYPNFSPEEFILYRIVQIWGAATLD